MTSPESYREMINLAWTDHLHTRDQTWKSLQIEVALAAGMLGVDIGIGSDYVLASIAISSLVAFAAFFGIQITLHHREVMIKNFTHITKCENKLGLGEITGYSDDNRPSEMKFWHAFDPRKNNTSAYILRMHVTILFFAIVIASTRLFPLVIQYPEQATWIGIPAIFAVSLYIAFGFGVKIKLKERSSRVFDKEPANA